MNLLQACILIRATVATQLTFENRSQRLYKTPARTLTGPINTAVAQTPPTGFTSATKR